MPDLVSTGTPPLTQFFGPGKNRVKGKLRYISCILAERIKGSGLE